MDQLFERLETLFRSWVSPDLEQDAYSSTRGGHGGTGDADLDAAMAELDDYLDKNKSDREAREASEARRRAQESARQRAYQASRRPGGPPPIIIEDYKVLGLPFASPMPEVKSAYKRLLKEHHPDRHTGDPARLKRATELSARINDAYRRIEVYATTGKLPEEG